MHDRTQREAIVPGGTEVSYVYISIADSLVLTPLKQGIALGASIFHERIQRVLTVAYVAVAVSSNVVHRFV